MQNNLYFNSLYKKYQKAEKSSLIICNPEEGILSDIIPTAIARPEEFKTLAMQDYSNLPKADSEILKKTTITLQKMHAGLGSSVKRDQHLKENSKRSQLGSKGTDLFIPTSEGSISIAEAQILQAKQTANKRIYKKVNLQEFVNIETQEAVSLLWEGTNHIENCEGFERKDPIFQEMFKTISQDGELTVQRLAPAGHGYFGYKALLECFEGTVEDEIIAIGNGEDLNSSPDEKIFSWMAKSEIPLCMITTTKTAQDKKGGQISIVKGEGGSDHITIVEKAQAEASDQLAYFEKLGLRAGDKMSYFNTNIVLINTKALRALIKESMSDVDLESFMEIITPDVIQNTKTQDGKKYIQLEGALGSVMLNFDKYIRINYNKQAVHFLNLDESERSNFFCPIKTMDDFKKIFINEKRFDQENFRIKSL